ncbi:two-component system, response regulator YesN [Paenibacillus catalpae]|uniref:Two-component system, response regulator YesN n=1 Tax=Paenibacillus catalpae TaxID=1045775 RepID=A0A1I1V2D3_9BACL|nr:helix-turn-helix domain-containing protein [Paenibacillus catalpae]SFD77197.1 two-component system, response regulator YesN [Paenibacillus catalpae]
MHRLMIVDNEPIIVRGLQQLLTDEAPFELDVYGVHTAEEALRLLGMIRIDIALLDIRMPGMNGLELQARITEQWPHCKVVFLSGYDDFNYIQTAFRNGGVDYVLKMDGDEAILDAIQKAIDELSRSGEMNRLIDQAKDKLQQSLAPLQREYVTQVIHGLAAVKQERLNELQIKLDASSPSLLLLSRVDSWSPSHSDSDKALMYYALQNIAGELWSGCQSFSVMLDSSAMVTFIQPIPDDRWHRGSPQWIRFAVGQLETIQAACRQYLKLPVSLVASAEPVDWPIVHLKYSELKQMMFYGFGQRTEMLLTDVVNRNFTNGSHLASETIIKAQSRLKQLLSAEMSMENRLLHDFDELATLSRKLTGDHPFLYEMYNGVAYMLLSALNQHSRKEEFPDDWPKKLISLEAHSSWEDALDYLRTIVSRLLQIRNEQSEAGAHLLVAKLKAFIEMHLDEDLSLVRLAETVYLNPTYLSRLFKQQTGQGISEYIAELRLSKSCDLLKYSRLKIQEIALKVGFDSATSFGRFFKREMNATPQEYRDSAS